MESFIFTLIFVLCLSSLFGKYDSTDNPGAKKWGDRRSGMSLFTDHQTGCQYLRAGYFGGITPRLDAQGNHVCMEVRPHPTDSLGE